MAELGVEGQVDDRPGRLAQRIKFFAYDDPVDEAQLLLLLDDLRAGRTEAAKARSGGLDGTLGRLLGSFLAAWTDHAAGDDAAALKTLDGQPKDDGLKPVRTYHAAVIETLAGRPRAARARLQPLLEGDEAKPLRLVLTQAAIEAKLGDREAARGLVESQLVLVGDNDVYADVLERIEAGKNLPLPFGDALGGLGDALFTLARAFADQEIDWQGLVLARLAAFAAPKDDDLRLYIGQSELAADRPEAALDALGRIGEASPFHWRAGLLVAEAMADLGREDEALAKLEAMADERPERTEALVARGDMLRRDERWAEAEKDYTAALTRIDEMTPDDWRLLYARGIAYERTGRWPDAEADFLEALELQPDQPYVLNYLGYSWVDKGVHLKRGLDMLERAVELRPDDGFVVDSLGWAHYRLGRYEEAVQELEHALELEPGDPVINDHLGDAYWRAGREREAHFQWERSLVFKPEPEIAAEVRTKLAQGLPAAASPGGAAPTKAAKDGG